MAQDSSLAQPTPSMPVDGPSSSSTELDYSDLIPFITDSNRYLRELRGLDPSQPSHVTKSRELAMEIYACFAQLRDECSTILRELRQDFHLKEKEMKQWMLACSKATDEEEKKTEESKTPQPQA